MIPAPHNPPMTWAKMYAGTLRQGKSRNVANAIVTAGLIWPPEMPEETQTPRAVPTAHPKLSER